jgi:uncharacterized protein YdaU (DUF1376 family)
VSGTTLATSTVPMKRTPPIWLRRRPSTSEDAAINYYEHHIGDYEAATAHLSLEEDAVYARMLRRYYMQEGPLPVAVESVARLIRAREQVEVVKAMLLEFFTLADDGWHHKRCDEEIERYRVKTQKKREAANARWSAEDVKGECTRIADAMQSGDAVHNGCNALQSPVPNPQSPVVSIAADGCPHAEIVAAYHDILPANPRIRTWSGSRPKNLRARWREDPKRQTVDYWCRFFRHVAASEFLTGRKVDREGRPFLPGLDWLVKPDNFAKVIEGRYHDRSAA